ncbi:hypothetical protein ERJ75_001245900 [Trypanosoma vivax]|nr:hypothetical protein ERJ75_001245900 [Trypanosoma vivax]
MFNPQLAHVALALAIFALSCLNVHGYGAPRGSGVNPALGKMESELLCGALNFYKMWHEDVNENEKILKSLMSTSGARAESSGGFVSTTEGQAAVKVLVSALEKLRDNMERFLLGVERDFFLPFEAVKFNKGNYAYGYTSSFVEKGRANEALFFLCNKTTALYCREQKWWEEPRRETAAHHLSSMEAALESLRVRDERSKEIGVSLSERLGRVLTSIASFKNASHKSVWNASITPAALIVDGCRRRAERQNHSDGYLVRIVSEMLRGPKADILYENGCDASRLLFLEIAKNFTVSTGVNGTMLGDAVCTEVKKVSGKLRQVLESVGGVRRWKSNWEKVWVSGLGELIEKKAGNCTAWVHPLERLRSRFEKEGPAVQNYIHKVRQATILLLSESGPSQLSLTDVPSNATKSGMARDTDAVDEDVSLCPRRKKLFGANVLEEKDVNLLREEAVASLQPSEADTFLRLKETFRVIKKRLKQKEREECPHLYESFLRLLHL